MLMLKPCVVLHSAVSPRGSFVYNFSLDSSSSKHFDQMGGFFFCLLQGYQFEEDNPYLSHPDPLSEGVKRMEAGDIPGAVRFFESAVQKEPDNQLVRFPVFSC